MNQSLRDMAKVRAIALFVALLLCAFPSAAMAWHSPQGEERAELLTATRRIEIVEGVACLAEARVSRSGTWAKADVFPCGQRDTAQPVPVLFSKTGASGAWKAYPQRDICVPPDLRMPASVLKDLDLIRCSR